jgi:hypothetical protein
MSLAQLSIASATTVVFRTRFGLFQDQEKNWLMSLAAPDVSGNRGIWRRRFRDKCRYIFDGM